LEQRRRETNRLGVVFVHERQDRLRDETRDDEPRDARNLGGKLVPNTEVVSVHLEVGSAVEPKCKAK
jgi:hypothetical protein